MTTYQCVSSTNVFVNITNNNQVVVTSSASATASSTGTNVEKLQSENELISINLAIENANKLISNPNERLVITNTHTESVLTEIKDEVITLYYRRTIKGTDTINSVNVDYINVNKGEAYAYAGISNSYMMDANGDEDKNQIVSFVGYRTPASSSLDFPPLFNETINIRTIIDNKASPPLYNCISAVALYNDSGDTEITTIPLVVYDVTTASGIFKGYNYLSIFFNNIENTRVVKISKNEPIIFL